MAGDTLLQLIVFAVAALFTPGPNNIMLASSGARFGLGRTLPHLFGVTTGFALMLFAIALGLGTVFERSALLREALRWLSAAVMLWIGWKIGTAGRAGETEAERPFTYLEAAAFQWINPKAWTIAIAVAAGSATGTAPILEAAIVALVFLAVGIASAATWTLAGTAIRRFLSSERRLRLFNAAMGLMVAACAAMLFV